MFDKERVLGLGDLRRVQAIRFYANASAIKTAGDGAIMKKRVSGTAMPDRHGGYKNKSCESVLRAS